MSIQTSMSVGDLAEAAIDMFLEYRDVHGKDEDAARLAAIREIEEGVEAEQYLRSIGELPPLENEAKAPQASELGPVA
jgi:hypothetical protein